MPFREAHPARIRRAFITATLDQGMTVNLAHAEALADKIPGVKPHEVPPIGTVRAWRTEEARVRETQARAGTPDGSAEMVDDVLSKITLALSAEARRLSRKRPRATPAEWAELAKAAGQVGKARREADGPTRTKRTPNTPAPTDDTGTSDPDAESSWLDGIDPDA